MNTGIGHRRPPRNQSTYRKAAWLLKILSIVYLTILGSMMYLETRLVFPGAGIDRGDWNHPGIDLQEVEFESIDGTPLHGYFFPQPNAQATILFCHGNEENVAMLAPEMDRLRKLLNARIFVFDYRGFGRSQGEPKERSILEDAEAATGWLCKATGQYVEDLVLVGRSLGGGVAVHLASRFTPRGLVLDRTFSSTVDVAASRYWWLPVRLVMRNQFLSVAKLAITRDRFFKCTGPPMKSFPFGRLVACSNVPRLTLKSSWKFPASPITNRVLKNTLINSRGLSTTCPLLILRHWPRPRIGELELADGWDQHGQCCESVSTSDRGDYGQLLATENKTRDGEESHKGESEGGQADCGRGVART